VDPPGPAAVDESHPCTAVRQFAQQRFIDQLIASLPSIRYVLLAGLEPEPTPEYILRLGRRIEWLESRGIRVILFTPHLIPPFNIEGCVPRPLAEKRNTCELGLEAHALQQQRFAPLVAAMSKAHPRVLVFDQNAVFCDARTCSMLRNGQLLLRDHTHISEFGSRLVAASFADWARSNVVDLLDGAAPATAGSPAGR
jgi:hypothetical protein